MTARARAVLDDCKLALEFLDHSTSSQVWRVHWVAAMALVRTIGDVLHKVDSVRDQHVGEAAYEAFQLWKADRNGHQILWAFIKRERDNLLHQYQSDVNPSARISLAVEITLAPADGNGPKKKMVEVAEIDENIYRPMLTGPWEGDDARDVLLEALDWRDDQLSKIEQQSDWARLRGIH